LLRDQVHFLLENLLKALDEPHIANKAHRLPQPHQNIYVALGLVFAPRHASENAP
jgi:hypothetical protein